MKHLTDREFIYLLFGIAIGAVFVTVVAILILNQNCKPDTNKSSPLQWHEVRNFTFPVTKTDIRPLRRFLVVTYLQNSVSPSKSQNQGGYRDRTVPSLLATLWAKPLYEVNGPVETSEWIINVAVIGVLFLVLALAGVRCINDVMFGAGLLCFMLALGLLFWLASEVLP